MEVPCWAVVPLANASAERRAVLAALADCPHLRLLPDGYLQTAIRSADGIVLVSGADALDAVLECIATIRRERPRMAIVVSMRDADEFGLDAVIRAGVSDFVSLPATCAEWGARLQRAGADKISALDAVAISSAPIESGEPSAPEPTPAIRGFVHASPACAAIAARLPVLAGCDASVLIVGETGTGKEVCAQAIHYLSKRADRPWVAVNCGAIPVDLVENELFGHVKGAYTHAHSACTGLVREAEGGTLFLDDVDCLPLSAQAKLLRFLQEREYRPVGSNTVHRADLRVIAASNCNLCVLAQNGGFRQDLYYRLNVLNLTLPPLRQRREDIALLARHFSAHFSREFGRPYGRCGPAFTPGAMDLLLAHDWPGNVRELRHVIERAVLLARGSMLVREDIQIDGAQGGEPDANELASIADAERASFRSAKQRVVDDFERGYVERLLAVHGGNVTHAAMAAKKDRRAFFELMRKHRIEPSRFRSFEHEPG
ncbi:sigma-54 interaction domain-containing protein [Lysobacter capsici]|uniref:sigma-54 interaction domain-containing protein n=1 Tax=Lysobacter capsici TaxID=435897 RepID=UPI001C00132E|nr:sigma-54 dependent transcriptional regulator [Lysobacter capsici]QWF19503.1 sigma-54 dependent transcriptional regulator [Lysobacter capsici]